MSRWKWLRGGPSAGWRADVNVGRRREAWLGVTRATGHGAVSDREDGAEELPGLARWV